MSNPDWLYMVKYESLSVYQIKNVKLTVQLCTSKKIQHG